jgi:hypothetical protein
MKTLLNIFRAFIGLLLVFAFHIPNLIWCLLLLSYAAVFNNHENLTANPREHLHRALRHLRKDNSQLLYAALEIRLALERMTDHEVVLASAASRGVLKKNDPVKETNYLRVLDEASQFPHKVILRNKETGESIDFGQYKPLDSKKVRDIDGRTGNLLHAKHGIPYGVTDHPWYGETREFLRESAGYLLERYEGNTPFFAFENIDHIEMVMDESPSIT